MADPTPADYHLTYLRERWERDRSSRVFLQLAEGVDDETWLYHLRQGDYSRWVRGGVKNETLALECEEVERNESLDAQESRQRLRSVIEKYYTLPTASAVKDPLPKG